MTPLDALRPNPKPLLFDRLVVPPPFVVFVCSLVLGLGIIVWHARTAFARDFIGVLLVSDLLSLLAYLLRNRQQLQAALSEAAQELTREKAESQIRLEAAVRSGQESNQATEARLQAAESWAKELQVRLDTQTRSADEIARAGQAGLAESDAALKKAEQTIAELQSRLDAAAHAEKEIAATMKTRSKQTEETIAALKTRLESATRSAAQAAQTHEVEIQKLKEANHQLKENVSRAEQSESRVAELTLLLEKAEAKLRDKAEASQIAPTIKTAPAQSETGSAAKKEEPPVAPSAHTPTRTATVLTNRTGTADSGGTAASDSAPAPTITSTAKYPATTLLTKPPDPPSPGKSAKAPRRKKNDNQIDLFESQPAPAKSELDNKLKTEPPPKPQEVSPTRRLPPTPPLDLAELRKAANEIVPLLGDQDPGAADCLKANRVAFRSAFSPEGFAEFEQLVKGSQFGEALEHLRKAARKHGISA